MILGRIDSTYNLNVFLGLERRVLKEFSCLTLSFNKILGFIKIINECHYY